jgi:hypothetical protein
MPSIVDVLLEADPDSLGLMRQRVQALAHTEDPKISGVPSFVRLQKIPQLHFMSMQIFEDAHFDPLLVFENNFDGDADAYWQSVLGQLSEDLRAIFACTKEAKTAAWAPLFLPGKTDSLVAFLKAHSFRPSAQHFGAVADSRARIQRDQGVFEDLQAELGATAERYRTLDAPAIQNALRRWAWEKYPWMKQPERPTTAQAIAAYQWTGWAPVLTGVGALILSLWALLELCCSSYLLRHGYPDARFVLRALLVMMVVAVFTAAILFWKTLRHLEESDLTQSDPQLSPDQLKLFAAQEDQIVQNHLASMVLVKPGMIRGFLIRAALRVLKLLVPIAFWNGYLGSMRTIHFAHWTLVGNSGRLLFLSNFDGSWQSYLDDFVDKASHGLTLAWGNCVGFPRTQDLVLQGAAHGPEFKAWARQSQTQSILWYSAYPTLTVNEIIRNASIVDGLRKGSMRQKEAEQWAQLL